MTLRRTSHTLLAIGLLAAFAGANASVLTASSSVNVSNVQLGVIDLTPDDGQTGGYAQGSFAAAAESLLFTDAHQAFQDESRRDAPWSGADTTAVSYGAARAYTSMSGIFGQGQSGATLSGSGVGVGFTEFYYLMNGMLSPHTTLVLTGHITMTASVAGIDPARDARASFGATFSLARKRWDTPALDYLNLSTAVDSSGPGETLDREFRLTYANNTDFAQSVHVSMAYGARAYSAIIPVPEPRSYAMLGAGLLLLGAAARRRKHAAQA